MSSVKLTETNKTPTLKKISVVQIKLSDQPAGYIFEGKYLGTTMGAPFSKTDEKTGQVYEQHMTFCVFQNDKGERFKVNQDKGLLNGMSDAMVREGDWIKVVKLEKVSIGKSRTMNSYDIYTIGD